MTSLLPKLASILCFFLTSSEVVAKDCKTIFPSYQIDNKERAKSLGCFHSPGRGAIITDATSVNLRDTIDWHLWVKVGHAKDMVIRCAKIAQKANSKYFGLEFYGECYHGNNIDTTGGMVTEQDGCKELCSWDVGGPLAMVLYKVKDSSYIGCGTEHTGYRLDDKNVAWIVYCGYNKNDGGNMFQNPKILDFKHLVDKNLWSKQNHAGDMIKRCGMEAAKQGLHVFGVYDYGLCYMATHFRLSVQGHPMSGQDCQHCKWDVGSSGAMTVFIVTKE